MLTLLYTSPILLVLTIIFILRRPPMHAALIGALFSILLWMMGVGLPFSGRLSALITQDTVVLFLSIAFVITPGILLIILIEQTGANRALAKWVKSLSLKGPYQLSFIILGLAPLLESMTGFGVSLVAIMPLLLALFDRQQALKISLSALVIMPWGTLGLATIVGATLLPINPMILASASALTSLPVFIILALIATWSAGYRSPSALFSTFLISSLFVTILYTSSKFLGPEVAGMCSGFVIVIMGFILAKWRNHVIISWPSDAWPYLLLFICVLMIKLIIITTNLDAVLMVKGTQINWKPLTSPGIPLLIVVMLLLMRRKIPIPLLSPLYRRAKRPLLTILFFLLMSQVMIKAGFISNVSDSLAGLEHLTLTPLVAVFAGISGYITGSNVGGNLLMMPTISHLATDNLIWLAAIQNSAAGHAALGSLPMIAVISGLAKLNQIEERQLTHFALMIVLLNVLLVTLAGLLLGYGL